MMYDVVISPNAKEDLLRLRRFEPAAYKKANKLIEELRLHPQTGTGRPERLKGNRVGEWSRRITEKHRMIYEIFEKEVYVDVLSAYGHYGDK